MLAINPAVDCHYILQGPRLPSQMQSVTALGRYQFILLGEQRHNHIWWQLKYVNKLAPYVTDGRLFTTDVSAKFKVTWVRNRTNIKNSAQTNLDIVPSLIIRGQLPVPTVNGTWDSFWKWRQISNFKGLVTLTLDRVILHTVVHQSSTSTYMPNFIEIKGTFCGWTFETHFIRPTQESRPKNSRT